MKMESNSDGRFFVMRLVVFVVLSFWFSIGQADWIDPAQKIELIGTGISSDGIYVVTVEKLKSAQFSACGFVFKMTNSRPLFDQKLSMMLSAFHAGAKMRFYVTGCDAQGNLILEGVDIVH